MPREQINYRRRLEVAEQTCSNEPGTPMPKGIPIVEPIVHVTWLASKDGAGHVQVALEVDTEYARMALESPNGDSEGTTFLYSPVLGREELNKLIRCARRGRDQAYGRDE